MIEKEICDKGFIWNPINSECECDKSCDVGEHLDYVNCKCRKILVDTLIEKYTENVEDAKIIRITLFVHKNKFRSSCRIYVVLIVIVFTIWIGIGTYFIYCKFMNYDKKIASKYDYIYQASNY